MFPLVLIQPLFSGSVCSFNRLGGGFGSFVHFGADNVAAAATVAVAAAAAAAAAAAVVHWSADCIWIIRHLGNAELYTILVVGIIIMVGRWQR